MESIHIGDLSVAQVLKLTRPVALIYHKQGTIIGYVLPDTPQVRAAIDQIYTQEDSNGQEHEHDHSSA